MVVVSGDKMETSSVIPVIGGSSGAVAGSIKNVMEDDPSILQVKQEDIAVQESPFLRIMGWFHTPNLVYCCWTWFYYLIISFHTLTNHFLLHFR